MDKFYYNGKQFSRQDILADAKRFSNRIDWSNESPDMYTAALFAPAERGVKNLDTAFFEKCTRHMSRRHVLFAL